MGVHFVWLSAHSEETEADTRCHICVWGFPLWKKPVGSCEWMKYVLFLIDKAVNLQDLRSWVRKEAVWFLETAAQRPEAPCTSPGFLVLLLSTAG